MLDDQDRDRLFEELKEKLELVEQRVEELEEAPSEEETEQDDISFGSVDLNLPFRVHWVFEEDVDSSTCSDIDTVAEAQLELLKVAKKRQGDPKSHDVNHGDLLVLLCNHYKAEETEESESESTEDFKDACYYVGMCVSSRGAGQVIPTSNANPPLGGSFVGDDTMRVIVWDTCGGGGGVLPPEEPCQESPKIFETVSNLNFDIETTGDDCKTIKFTLTGDVKKLTFACGKLINDEDESPISIEKTIEVAGCKDCECECNEGTYPCISENDAFGKTVELFMHNGIDWGNSHATETYDNWVTSENGCEGYYDQASRGTYKVKYMASQNCEKYFSISIMMGWNGGTPDANGDVWEPVTNIVNGVYFPSNNHGTLDNPSFNDVKYVFS